MIRRRLLRQSWTSSELSFSFQDAGREQDRRGVADSQGEQMQRKPKPDSGSQAKTAAVTAAWQSVPGRPG